MGIVYILLLLLQAVALVFAICQKSTKARLTSLLFSLGCAPLAWGLGAYFDSLPGYGFMPGLTYFAEALLGYGTALLSLGFAALSGILWIVLRKKK